MPETKNLTSALYCIGNREVREQLMGKIKDKVVGKTKQVVAELIGDGELARAGKEQDKKADNEPVVKPFGNLDKLT